MKSFSQYSIDRMVYREVPKPKHQKRLDAPEDYAYLNCTSLDAPVMMFPPNSSIDVQSELCLINHHVQMCQDPSGLEGKYDDDFNWAFEELCNSNGLEYDKDYFKALMKECASITIRLKYRFNRPRPYQLAPVLGVDLMVQDSDTAKTPSFPSGHSMQAMTQALVIAKMYPSIKKEAIKLAKDVSKSRIVGGHHYPSDVEYGEFLGQWICQHVEIPDINN
jgi:hypothetical protein